MKLPYCSRCNQPRTPEQLRRGICGACRRHRCDKHQPGNRSCYAHDGCRCDRCCEASYVYDKRRRLGVGGRAIDAEPIKRRIRALMRIGWRAADIAKEAQWSSAQCVLEMMDNLYIRQPSAARISAAYERLAGRPGPSDQGRRRAASKGWPPPLAWDDGTGPHGIDNPQATPYTAKTSFRKAAEMVEELRHIIDTDTPENIARRLGYANLGSLSKTLDRIGEHALARRIDQGRRAA